MLAKPVPTRLGPLPPMRAETAHIKGAWRLCPLPWLGNAGTYARYGLIFYV